MANQDELISWALSKRLFLGLQVTELGWPNTIGFPIFNIDVKSVFSGIEFVGSGSSATTNGAFAIAVAESLERASFANAHLECDAFHGTAAHSDAAQARKNAICEMIERDAFLSHFYTQTAFVEDSRLASYHFSKLAEGYCAKHKINLSIRKLITPPEYEGVVAVAIGEDADEPFGAIIGLSCGTRTKSPEEQEKLVNRALIECLRNVTDCIEAKSIRRLIEEDFLKLTKPGPLDHLALYRCPAMSANLKKLVDTTEWKGPLTTTLPPFSTSEINPPSDLKFPHPPLFFVGARSDFLLATRWGQPKLTTNELRRMEHFTGRSLVESDLNLAPHPLA